MELKVNVIQVASPRLWKKAEFKSRIIINIWSTLYKKNMPHRALSVAPVPVGAQPANNNYSNSSIARGRLVICVDLLTRTGSVSTQDARCSYASVLTPQSICNPPRLAANKDLRRPRCDKYGNYKTMTMVMGAPELNPILILLDVTKKPR